MIYLIGGTPRAGKSTLAKKLLERKSISYVPTDVLLHMVNETQSELSLTKPYSEIPEKFLPYLTNLIKHLQSTVRDFTIEGDAFWPEQVIELQRQFEIRVCFLGFSQITLEQIKKYVGENDWINQTSEDEQSKLPQWIMETSERLKKECTKHVLSYVDMAEGVYEQNIEKAYTYLTSSW